MDDTNPVVRLSRAHTDYVEALTDLLAIATLDDEITYESEFGEPPLDPEDVPVFDLPSPDKCGCGLACPFCEEYEL
ncbi:hypothetical protein [Pyruvatibacter mobilis]|uniref:hypothetical protein n=1 Tax=Pyruvatibacter mobilis TaxID=1712261 RepID=UPI003BAD4933